MNEDDIIKELFSKTDLNYQIGGIEEGVLKKIVTQNIYRKKKRVYDLIGKIGLSFFVILCLLFTLIIGEEDTLYLFLGIPFTLFLLMFPLEILLNQIITK